ncbi:hypothetical protein GCM10028793_36530 [Nocardiopsis oceani]
MVGHRHVGDEVELLVDGGDALAFGVLGVPDDGLPSLDEDAPPVGQVRAGEDLDERALSGPVLTQQDVDLAAAQVEVDVVERDHAREGLAYALDAQQFFRTTHVWLLRSGLAVRARRRIGLRRGGRAGRSTVLVRRR